MYFCFEYTAIQISFNWSIENITKVIKFLYWPKIPLDFGGSLTGALFTYCTVGYEVTVLWS